MAEADTPPPELEWADAPPTVIDADPVTAPHAVVAELAAQEVARAQIGQREHARWYALGQDDAICALRALLARRGLTDVEIQNIVLEVSQGCTPL